MHSSQRSFVAPFILALALAGCGKQGEGQRCDRSNGDGDCSDGLTCTLVYNPQQTSAYCCPAARFTSSHLECKLGPPDAGSTVADTANATGGALDSANSTDSLIDSTTADGAATSDAPTDDGTVQGDALASDADAASDAQGFESANASESGSDSATVDSDAAESD